MFWKWIGALIGCLFFMTSYASDRSLTPPNEPHDANFYVCYVTRTTHCSVCTFYARYLQIKYIGCIISRTPCALHKVRLKYRKLKIIHTNPGAVSNKCLIQNSCCPSSCRMELFGCYDTYLQALNAFYRCAYN